MIEIMEFAGIILGSLVIAAMVCLLGWMFIDIWVKVDEIHKHLGLHPDEPPKEEEKSDVH